MVMTVAFAVVVSVEMSGLYAARFEVFGYVIHVGDPSQSFVCHGGAAVLK
jgi:hypothetical protein